MPSPTGSELRDAYAGRSVFLTGHTGFKGSWLTAWLAELGARVTGYALGPPTAPSLFEAAGIGSLLAESHLADVRDLTRLRAVLRASRPEVVFHLAAQPLVRVSYEQPVETLDVNVRGTAHVLEAIRLEDLRCAVVLVTSDKCYEHADADPPHVEDGPMGGHDPYSMSKGAAELAAASWRRSFFPPARLESHGVAVATARSGNVVGGGDWAPDRLVPDAVAALAAGRPVAVRNPRSVRPWQHVLEPLGGYLLLGARLRGVGTARPEAFCAAWNFGPGAASARPVREVVEEVVRLWGRGAWVDAHDPDAPHESGLLRLSIERARNRLGWAPRWSLEEALRRSVEWYRAYEDGERGAALRARCTAQIRDFLDAPAERGA